MLFTAVLATIVKPEVSVKFAKLPLPKAVKFDWTTLSIEVSPAKIETFGAVTVAEPRLFDCVYTIVLGVPASSTTGIAASVLDTIAFPTSLTAAEAGVTLEAAALGAALIGLAALSVVLDAVCIVTSGALDCAACLTIGVALDDVAGATEAVTELVASGVADGVAAEADAGCVCSWLSAFGCAATVAGAAVVAAVGAAMVAAEAAVLGTAGAV